jgi:hypothetical protein
MITPNEAKRIIKQELDKRQLPYTKLTAKTVDFTDLARDSKLFITIHGWKGNPQMADLERIAHDNSFIVRA